MIPHYSHWIFRFIPKGYDALTLGGHVFFRSDSPSPRLVAHEKKHVEQYATLGVIGFLWFYISDYFHGRLKGLSHREAYLAIRLEVEAREAESSC